MKSLWNIFDGEPFMENPPLGILSLSNRPKTRKIGGKKMAVRRRSRRVHRRGRKRSTRRATRSTSRRVVRRTPRRRRRNWATAGMVVPPNPRRRRRSSRRRNPVHHRRRRNPGLFSMSGFPSIKSVTFVGVGFVGPSLVSGFLSKTFPSVMQQTTSLGIAGKYLVKIGSILGLSWLTRRFVGSSEAQMVMIGGGANIALSLVNDFAPGMLPANPLGMYLPTVFPAAGARGGMQAYIPLRGLNAQRIPSPAAFGLHGNGMRAANASPSGAYGGTAARFKRF